MKCKSPLVSMESEDALLGSGEAPRPEVVASKSRHMLQTRLRQALLINHEATARLMHCTTTNTTTAMCTLSTQGENGMLGET